MAEDEKKVGKIAASLGGTLQTVSLADIEVSERYRQDYGDINDLAFSMKEKGQLQNIVLEPGQNNKYKLRAGGRRYMAMTEKLGWTECKALVFNRELTELEALEVEWEENFHRKDLDWAEELALKRKIQDLRVIQFGEKIGKSADSPGTSLRDTAKILNVSPSNLSADLQLAKVVELKPEFFEGCKTKREAQKLLKFAMENISRQKIAEEVRANAGGESRLQSIIDRYIIKDFFTGVCDIPDESIDFVEIDPPYAINLNEVKRMDGLKISLSGYNEVDMKEYTVFITKVLTECYRVMTEHSWGILWHGVDPWGSILYEILQNVGFQLSRLTGKWIKPQGQTNQPTLYLANACEEFFYFRKGTPTIVRQGRTNIFAYNQVPPARKTHPTERPIELIQEILSTFCWEGARILVPFLGSGTTILAAETLNMRAFGYELSAIFKDAYVIRAKEIVECSAAQTAQPSS